MELYGRFTSFAPVRLASLTISVIIAGLIHIIIELVIMCYVDPYELLIRTVRYCLPVEVLDKDLPLACDVSRSEPTKVVAVSDDKYRLNICTLAK